MSPLDKLRAIAESNASSTEKAVLKQVAIYEGDAGCYASSLRIAADLSMGERTVRRAIKGLVGRGLLAVPRPGRPSLLKVDLEGLSPRNSGPEFHSAYWTERLATPATDDKTPATDDKTPAAECRTPAAECRTPAIDARGAEPRPLTTPTPATEYRTPAIHDTNPGHCGRVKGQERDKERDKKKARESDPGQGDLLPDPGPAKPRAPQLSDVVAAEWAALWAERCALGKAQSAGAPRGGSLSKGARGPIAKALKAGHSAEDLLLVARWAFRAPGFSPKALRGEKDGSPLNEYLNTTSVYRTTKLQDKLAQAQRWEDQGSPSDPDLGRPKGAAGRTQVPGQTASVLQMLDQVEGWVSRYGRWERLEPTLEPGAAKALGEVLCMATGESHPRAAFHVLGQSNDFKFEQTLKKARSLVGTR